MAGLGAVGDATSYVAAAVQVGAPPGVRGGRRDVPRTFNVDGRGRRGGRRGYFKDGRWGGTHACGVTELRLLPCLPPDPSRLVSLLLGGRRCRFASMLGLRGTKCRQDVVLKRHESVSVRPLEPCALLTMMLAETGGGQTIKREGACSLE